MSSMWILAAMAVLLIAAMLALSRPWWPGSRKDGTPARTAANVAVYRQRLLEIDADEAAGLLDATTAAQIRDEHAARLLKDADETRPQASVRPGKVWLLLALVPVLAIGAYAVSGRWQLAEKIEQARVDPDVASELALDHGLEQLKSHLERQPEDAEAWARLGEIELSRNRAQAAASAYARATALVPDRGDWWAAEGEALAIVQSHDLRGAPAGRFERALVLSPNDSKALFYGGLVAAQTGDFALATQRWSRLKQRNDLPPGVATFIETSLAQWADLGDEGEAPVDETPSGPPSIPSSTLSVMLTLEAGRGTPPQALNTLTVFARPVSGGMPLAVRRQIVSTADFPLAISLSDADAMTPEALLSQASSVEVVARLSRGEGVAAQPEDWEARQVLNEGASRSSLQLHLAPRQ